MTHTASAHTGNFWDFEFPVPQATQDTDLLRQLPFVPGLKEILTLRQVHALEHATVWVLGNLAGTSQPDEDTLGGLSTDEGFYLYGQLNLADLRRAVPIALTRLTRGEWDLAVHPRCGTNLSVGMFLTAGLALGAHLLLPRGPIEQLVGFGLATATATQLTPDLGRLAQRYLTTAIPFNLIVEDITATSDIWGRPAHFVRVRWRD
ncbi:MULTISPECIES: DUF6391 domain-containing protein [unclassified Coleofasciculus]|uniref:DUF6391 domain-containing protein n=1 Tax=unclassified Coleofasciculus TaxID=2692782 RepID=UPI00187E7F72|nr:MULTISPECIES: DUF6391 domain-containing protein [unclassified Coleofasciculus]MBE9130003.1 hypothetical protein [Coleofasciculus sp. LEGE 07081]MBE9151561.1 hypothetical protein [Coleofasciculus sp. LEGE 07092]